jgi:hypothetical protein
MKIPNTTVTLPKIAAAIAAALAITATVLAIPAQATSTPAARGFTEMSILPATTSGWTKLFVTSAHTASAAGIKLERLTSPITAGADATLTVRTSRATTCSISVYYKSGPSQAGGLYPKRGARISWIWKVGTRTTPGSSPIIVSCGKAGSLQTSSSVPAGGV